MDFNQENNSTSMNDQAIIQNRIMISRPTGFAQRTICIDTSKVLLNIFVSKFHILILLEDLTTNFSLFRIIELRLVEDTTIKPQIISMIRWQPTFNIIFIMTSIWVIF